MEIDRSYMLLNPLPDPEPPELFIINPLLDGLEVGGGPPLFNKKQIRLKIQYISGPSLEGVP